MCHLQELLDLPQVNVSQDLADLRKAGLVEFTRVQTWKVYRLRSPRLHEVELSLRSYNMTVESLNELDLSYTPPLSSPWDPVQMAAQAWC